MVKEEFIKKLLKEFEKEYLGVVIEDLGNIEFEPDCYNIIVYFCDNEYQLKNEEKHYVDILMENGKPIKFELSEYTCIYNNYAWQFLMSEFIKNKE